jgi:hypothetical protein
MLTKHSGQLGLPKLHHYSSPLSKVVEEKLNERNRLQENSTRLYFNSLGVAQGVHDVLRLLMGCLDTQSSRLPFSLIHDEF